MFVKIKKMKKKNLAVVFGAKSAEHEVSIVTVFQAYEWIDKSKYEVFLIYIDRENKAFLCPKLRKEDYKSFIEKILKQQKRIEFVKNGFLLKNKFYWKRYKLDVALLIMHGSFGEDGKIQGMFDFLNIAYTGSDVVGSALGMDKVLMKSVLKELGLPVLPYVWFYKREFRENKKEFLAKINKDLKYPIFVKPANAGSSVGITRVDSNRQLVKAIDYALRFDRKVLVEQGLDNAVDINCAVMRDGEIKTTVCEQPISEDKFLSFEEKYLKGGKRKGMASLSRIMPAPISDKVSVRIGEMTRKIFRVLGGWGMARMDFLYQTKTGKLYPNEINTIPGSLAYYLWGGSGVKPRELIDKMINSAIRRQKETESLTCQFKSKILD